MASGSPIAGESYTLECSAGGSEGTFQWLGPPDGRTPVDDSSPRLNIISDATSSQLQFRPVQQSDNGSYSCSATTNGLALTSEAVIIVVNGTRPSMVFLCKCLFLSLAPPVSVLISDGGATPTAGQNYQLTCSVTGAENLNAVITYRWTSNDGSGQSQVGTNSSTLSFTPLRLSDAGSYVCGVTITSSYLSSDITAAMDSLNIRTQCELI